MFSNRNNWKSFYPPNIEIICLLLASVVLRTCQERNSGGWELKQERLFQQNLKCNIIVRDESLTPEEFLSTYAYDEPVVFKNTATNELFSKYCSRSNLLTKYSDLTIRLSSANSYSYDKVDVTLGYYIDKMMNPKNKSRFGNDVLPDSFDDLLELYVPPPYTVPNTKPTLSFGIAGEGTGVPFHFHGPGFSEVIYGRKHWFLYPPGKKPYFHPNDTTLQWYLEEYVKLREDNIPYECTVGPGEVIYFPDLWWHSTLNLDTSVFITTFLGPL